MPWIKIEVKDTNTPEKPTRAKPGRQADTRRSRLPWLLLGLVLLFGVVGTGFVLGTRFLNRQDVVATFNGQSITQQELDRERALFVTMSTLTQGRPPAQPPSEADLLNQMIADRLKEQEALRAGIVVSPAEVEAQINAIEAQAGFTEEQLRAALAQAGLERELLVQWLARQIAISRYINQVLLPSVPPAMQDAAVRNWSNNLQMNAEVEIRLSSGGTQKAAKVGEPAPDFELPTPEGVPIRLSTLRGKPVILNFWATWCPPCKIEMPDLEALYQKYSQQGLTILAVDQQEPPEAVRAYFEEMQLSFQPVIDSTGEIFNVYRVVALPTSYFIDASGTVRVQHRGMMTREQMENYVSQILPAAAP